ncbi:hypothetical protein ACFLRC_03480 [Candidatus Altiarchaeota archaeon]
MVDIPVHRPDDHLLIVSKQGPQFVPEESERIAEIWIRAFNYMPQDSVFILQAHPSVVSPDFLPALKGLLEFISRQGVEKKTLGEVTDLQLKENVW